MNVSDFDYELPEERIAQHPAARRDHSRLLVLDRGTGAVAHRRFDELPRLLRPGDLLVFNDTSVRPARLLGHKATGGRVELLLVERVEGDERSAVWRCMLKASRKPPAGGAIVFASGLAGRLVARDGDDWLVRFECACGRIDERLERAGRTPLPPYIRREPAAPDDEDRRRYQTVYARHPGAIAAPTAGLHFTEELLSELGRAGLARAWITLHVGPGTFQPVRVQRVEEHRLLDERFELPEATAEAVDATRRRCGRVVAVGTTTVRALETCAGEAGRVLPGSDRTGLFIYPGFRFRVVDAMITNFHLPRSTLLMLVSAFAGRERVHTAYAEALAHEYRFYSYGDAMLIEGAP